MAEPTACLDCLRRSWLLAALGPYIERVATGDSVLDPAPGTDAPCRDLDTPPST